jgi:hypothetical protein
MRLLLDECIDERLRHSFSGHACETTRYANLVGLKCANPSVAKQPMFAAGTRYTDNAKA